MVSENQRNRAGALALGRGALSDRDNLPRGNLAKRASGLPVEPRIVRILPYPVTN